MWRQRRPAADLCFSRYAGSYWGENGRPIALRAGRLASFGFDLGFGFSLASFGFGARKPAASNSSAVYSTSVSSPRWKLALTIAGGSFRQRLR